MALETPKTIHRGGTGVSVHMDDTSIAIVLKALIGTVEGLCGPIDNGN